MSRNLRRFAALLVLGALLVLAPSLAGHAHAGNAGSGHQACEKCAIASGAPLAPNATSVPASLADVGAATAHASPPALLPYAAESGSPRSPPPSSL